MEGLSLPAAGDVRPQVEDQGGADQAEAETRGDKGNQGSGGEHRKHHQRAAPRDALGTLRQ